MTATAQRDRVAKLAKTDVSRALRMAQEIEAPWYRVQALAYVARFAPADSEAIAEQAIKAATECTDVYKQCAVTAWPIAALAERSQQSVARSQLHDALEQAKRITPNSSRAEALTLLLHAAARVDTPSAERVANQIFEAARNDSHWRCQRAVADALSLLRHVGSDAGENLAGSISDAKLKAKCDRILKGAGTGPRPFFW